MDDFVDNAQTAGRLAIGGSARGAIEASGDSDWFAVNLIAGQRYSFDMIAAATDGLADPYLLLYDSSGKVRAGDDNSAGGNGARMVFTATETGVYYAAASSASINWWKTGAYSLTATKISTTDDFLQGTATSARVAVGATQQGVLDTSGDVDWFGVTLEAGKNYTFNLNGSGTAALANPYLRLYSPSGTTLYYDDDAGPGANAQLSFSAPSSGVYYLGVSGSVALGVAAGTGGYSLQVTAAAADDFAATAATTGRLLVEGKQSGQIETAADTDWFAITLNAGQSYTFSLAGAASGGLADPMLYLYDANGKWLAFDDNNGAGLDALLTWTATVSGTYYLAVATSFFGNASGTGAYELSARAVTADDFSASTATIGRIAPGASVKGHIDSAGDSDWFAAELVGGQTYTIDLDPAAAAGLKDPYLQVFDSKGILLASDDDSGSGLSAQLSFTAPTTGTFYFGASSTVTETAASSNYVLKLSAGVAPSDDYAANSGTLGRVTPGASASGTIEARGDHDWFSVSLKAGQSYTIGLAGSGGKALFDPSLRLYSSSGALLASDDDGGSGLASQLVYTAAASGTYYIDAGGSDMSSAVNTGGYTVSVAATGVADDYAGSTATTGKIAVGSSVAGRLEASLDSDWFGVRLTAGVNYIATLSGAASDGLGDPYLRLYSSIGTELLADDDGSVGLNAQLHFAVKSTGDYFFGASSGSTTANTGSYTLSLVRSTAVVDDFAASSATVGRVAVGGSSAGTIDSAGDHDWFAVTLEAGKNYTLGVNAAAGALADPQLRLYNSAGVEVGRDDDSGVGLNAELSYRPGASGTYYVDASGLGDAIGRYTVSASEQAATSPAASAFNIDIRYTGDPRFKVLFERAAERWASVITGDLPDVMTSTYGLIDDLLITATVTDIDGVGGTLGNASPTGLRAGGGLPVIGSMRFDVADMEAMYANNTLYGVILHEMGHVLGSGTLWSVRGLVNPNDRFEYIGSNALAAYRTVSGNASASFVPLESGGRVGTAGSHWSENVFDTELMTGYANQVMPLSIVTIGTMADLGYTVNYAAADPYYL